MNWRLTEAENEVQIVLMGHDTLALVGPCFVVNVFNCVHYFVGGKKAHGVIAIIWSLVRIVGIAHSLHIRQSIDSYILLHFIVTSITTIGRVTS